MGNCMKTGTASSTPTTCTTTTRGAEYDEQVPEEISTGGNNNNKGVKVKVLLTRAELEWLMAQLKNGEKKLEEVLAEMGREIRERDQIIKGRFDDEHDDHGSWKPSLESIVELPELLSNSFEF